MQGITRGVRACLDPSLSPSLLASLVLAPGADWRTCPQGGGSRQLSARWPGEDNWGRARLPGHDWVLPPLLWLCFVLLHAKPPLAPTLSLTLLRSLLRNWPWNVETPPHHCQQPLPCLQVPGNPCGICLLPSAMEMHALRPLPCSSSESPARPIMRNLGLKTALDHTEGFWLSDRNICTALGQPCLPCSS